MLHHRMRRVVAGAGAGPVSDGSAFNFHCTSTAGWSLFNQGNSVASLFNSTFFRAYSGATTDPANGALFIIGFIFTPPAGRSVINLPLEVDHLEDISTGTGRVLFEVTTIDATKRLLIRLHSDGLTIQDSSEIEQPFYIGPPPLGEQFTLRADVDVTNQLVDVWYNDDKKVTAADCGAAATTSGRIVYANQNTLASGFTPSTADLDQILIGGEA